MNPTKKISALELQNKIQNLKKNTKGNQNESHDYEALSEAYFRLALNTDTSWSDSVFYLKKAYKIDQINPRYSYHLARLFFLKNEFDKAILWIKNAIHLCPTSHRLWAHISLLHLELNQKNNEAGKYKKDELLGKSKEINKLIKEKRNSFDDKLLNFKPTEIKSPKKENEKEKGIVSQGKTSPGNKIKNSKDLPVEEKIINRITNADECRWSGIYDLESEAFLESEPTEMNRDRIIELLESIIQLISKREEGYTSFVALAVQWLVIGYPVATIKRFISKLPNSEKESIKWLLRFCSLFEEGKETLPSRLSTFVHSIEITPYLASIIYYKSVCHLPLKFNATYEFKSAREYINKKSPTETETAKYLNSLISALKTFIDETRQIVISDKIEIKFHEEYSVENEITILQDITEKFSELNAVALKILLEKISPLCKEDEKDKNYSIVKAECDNIQKYLDKLKEVATNAETTYNEINVYFEKAEVENEKKIEISQKLDTIKKVIDKLKNPNELLKKLKKGQIDSFLKNKPEKENTSDISAMHTLDFLANTEKFIKEKNLVQSKTNEKIEENTTEKPEEKIEINKETFDHLKDIKGLNELILIIQDEVALRVEKYEKPFLEFPKEFLNHPAIKKLQVMIFLQIAKLYYDIGLYPKAHAYWNKVLKIDLINLTALKNIAVSNSLKLNDTAHELYSWKIYFETLYFQAICLHDPRYLAEKRAQMHSAFASTYTLGTFKTTEEPNKNEERKEFITLLNNPVCLKEFIEHKMAEIFNIRIDVSTPVILLGTTRLASKEKLIQLKTQMDDFSNRICGLLPDRIKNAFQSICKAHFDSAFEVCQNPENLKSNKNLYYEQDSKKLIEWISDIYLLKHNFLNLFKDLHSSLPHINSIGIIFTIYELTNIPTETNEEFANKALFELSKQRKLRIYQGQDLTHIKNEITDFIIEPTCYFIILLLNNSLEINKSYKWLGQFIKSIKTHHDFWAKYRQKINLYLDHEKKGEFDILDWFDDPQQFYPKEVFEAIKAINNKIDVEENLKLAINNIKKFCESFPLISGSVKILNNLSPKEAKPFLERVSKEGISEKGRMECKRLLGHASMQKILSDVEKLDGKKKYETLEVKMQEILDKEDANVDATINICHAKYALGQDQMNERNYKKAIDYFNQAISFANEILSNPIEENIKKDIITIKTESPKLISHAKINEIIDVKNPTIDDLETIRKKLLKFLQDEPFNALAQYYLMLYTNNLGVTFSNNGELENAKQYIDEASAYAKELLNKDDASEDMKKGAKKIIEQSKKMY